MSTGTFSYPLPTNEPVLNYAPGSAEKKRLKEVLKELKSQVADIPQFIGAKEVRSGNKIAIHPPHEKKHVLGYFHKGEEKHVVQAIEAALAVMLSVSLLTRKTSTVLVSGLTLTIIALGAALAASLASLSN